MPNWRCCFPALLVVTFRPEFNAPWVGHRNVEIANEMLPLEQRVSLEKIEGPAGVADVANRR
jgi:hypothetical protein